MPTSSATRDDHLYMNGEPVATGAAPLNLNAWSSLKFGHRGNLADTPGSEDDRGFYLNEHIDEVQLFVGRAVIRRCKPETIQARLGRQH